MEKESADYLLRQERPFRETYAHDIRGLLGKDGAITKKTVATRSPLSSAHIGPRAASAGGYSGTSFEFGRSFRSFSWEGYLHCHSGIVQ